MARPPCCSKPLASSINMKARALKLYLALVVIGLVLAAGLWLLTGGGSSPVPKNVRTAVNFDIYYPQPKKLPAGFRLDNSSFKLAQAGVVLFSVKRPDGSSLIFSEEA